VVLTGGVLSMISDPQHHQEEQEGQTQQLRSSISPLHSYWLWSGDQHQEHGYTV